MTYHIIPYDHDHAAALAVMWNESDDQWPGTFTNGVPFDEKRIREWMDGFDPLQNLIVVQEDGAVVGYGSLQDTAEQSGVSCYVPLLNVHPDHQGRSLCRRMLQQMVQHATANGYGRITIGTWSGNVQSVPLYKKVGFFWTPGLDVGMENYIPLLLNLPAARPFFERADWYRDFRRELTQLPDKQQHPLTGEMPIFRLCWEHAGDTLEAVIDRHSQALTGLETADFAVYAEVANSEPAQGLTYPVHWHLHNKQAVPLAIKLKATGDVAIDVSHEACLTLAPYEKKSVSSSYLCRADAPPLNLDDKWDAKPLPSIHTTLQIGDVPLELTTGLAYRPAIRLSLSEATPTLVPGSPQPILVQLHNQQNRPISGMLQLDTTGELQADWQNHPFTLDANGFAGVPLTLCQATSGASQLRLTAVFDYEGQTVAAKLAETAVLSLPLGGVVVGTANQGRKDETHRIENEFFQITAKKEKSTLNIWTKGGHAPNIFYKEDLGPPHSPDDLAKQASEITLTQSAGQVKASFTIKSTRFPGLRLIRELTITASPIIQVRHRVENRGNETHRCYVQAIEGLIDLDYDNATITIPRQERLVSGVASTFMRHDNNLPKDPAGMAEQWAVLHVAGQNHGIIWPQETTRHEVRWGRLELRSPERTLAPGESTTFQPHYLYVGAGDWHDVQRAWQRLVGQQQRPYQPVSKPHEIGFAPTQMRVLSERFTADLVVDNLSSLAINGRLAITPPTGWQVQPRETAVAQAAAGQPQTIPVQFEAPPEALGPATGTIQLHTESADTAYPFTVLRLGDSAQSVTVSEEAGADEKGLWCVENGRFQWQIAPNYQAGVVAWHDETGTNHVHSLYPKQDGLFETFQPWFGGVQPVLRHDVSDWSEWPGKFYSESFTAKPITAPDSAGLPWHGVRVETKTQREKFVGLRAELDYLTLGRSNVLKLLFRVVNETPVWKTAVPGFHVYLQVDGTYANGTLHSSNGQQSKRTKQEQWGWHGSWSAVENSETGKTMALISASGRRRTHWLDWGEWGGHLYVEDDMKLAPHSTQTLAAYLVLADSVAEAAQYAVLAE